MVGYLFVNASQGVGDEIDVTPIFSAFMRVFGLFRDDFSKPPHRGCPTPKRAKNRFPNKIGKRFSHFLDTGREMIFDGPSEMSWGLTGEGGVLEKQENITASQARTHVL